MNLISLIKLWSMIHLLWDAGAHKHSLHLSGSAEGWVFLPDLGLKGEWWVVWFTHIGNVWLIINVIVTEHSAYSEPIYTVKLQFTINKNYTQCDKINLFN